MIRLLFGLLVLPQIMFAQADSLRLLLKKTDWNSQKIAPKAKWEQHHFAKGDALGCVEAINLDGGGSTTLWIDGTTKTGIVNMPCDDKVFDEYGERKVSNVLLLSLRKAKVND